MTQVKQVGEQFALDGTLALVVRSAVADLLAGKVDVTQHESMVGNDRIVTVFTSQAANPMLEWSSGEHLIWQFFRSLAGGTGINLALLAEQVGGQPEIVERLIACFAVSMGGDR